MVNLKPATFVFFLLGVAFFVPDVKGDPPEVLVYDSLTSKTPVASYDWGTFQVGETKVTDFYVENLVDSAVTGVSFRIDNVEPPEVEKFLILSGDSATNIKKSERGLTPVSLTVSKDVKDIETFSFDLVITSTFSETSSTSGGGGGGGGGWVTDREPAETVIPSTRPLLTDNQKAVLLLVAFIVVVQTIGNKRR